MFSVARLQAEILWSPIDSIEVECENTNLACSVKRINVLNCTDALDHLK